MNINPRIEYAFQDFRVEKSKIPISYQQYKGKSTTYLTYYTYYEEPIEFSDDKAGLECTYGTIDIFCKGNFKKVLKEVKKILKNNGFTVTDVGPEDFEEETGFYHVPVNFYLEGLDLD